MNRVLREVLQIFQHRGNETYGAECVSQLEHALQTASLAVDAGAEPTLVAAALLHDIGHIRPIDQGAVPVQSTEPAPPTLDDRHETSAFAWLVRCFGNAVADPIRLHVAAKRYLCTQDPSYQKSLSPVSYQSYLDQGGPMTASEMAAFEAEEFAQVALRLRRWDDAAKDQGKRTPPIESFLPYLQEVHAAVQHTHPDRTAE